MSLKTVFGLLASLILFSYSTFTSVADPTVLLDWRSFLIVIGGTICAGLVCFPLEEIMPMIKIFTKRLIHKNDQNYGLIIQELVRLSKAKQKGEKSFEEAISTVAHPFLKDGAELLFWSESDISDEELRDILETSLVTHYEEYMGKAEIFQTLAKFPPAFGMMGTTLGMIALLQTLGGSKGVDQIGPGMAVALITTLIGIACANLVFIPIAENLISKTKEDALVRKMIIEGLMLIQGQKPTRYLEQKLKYFLLPSVRDKLSIS
ncbi:MAG: MotA/TolQ/ExbB proton channel family protein [Deltaproteobacteria bacterium]|nr:MotA/TolQ/ExbB proton channel family protein [Deltaproteobacteria bacterium]